MLASNRDEWVTRLNEEWNEQINSAKSSATTDEMCKFSFLKKTKYN